MRILIVGGKGFIGRHVAEACRAMGHSDLVGARSKYQPDVICDLAADTDPAQWKPRLNNVDAVINCAGLLHGTVGELQAVHCDAPAAMAAACKAGRKPFLHISVLGLDGAPDTAYFSRKLAGERAILTANPAAIVVRPSVVFGLGSPATQLLLLQARLPVIVTPKHTGNIAPVHVEDVGQLCATLINTVRAAGAQVDCVGAQDMTIAQYVQHLRTALGHGPARVLHVPNSAARRALAIAALLPAKVLRTEALDLMEHTHTGDARMFVRWMRRPPRAVSMFLEQEDSAAQMPHT